MVTPAIFGGIMSIFVIASVVSKEYRNHSRIKQNRVNELRYRRNTRKYRK